MRQDEAPANALDDEVVNLARRFRKESIAALVAVTRDARAPAAARASAAAKLLEIGFGRPAQAKPVAVADVASMSMDECIALLRACCHRVEREHPGMLWEALYQAAHQCGQPKWNRYTRGEPAPLPEHIVPPRNRSHPVREPLAPGQQATGRINGSGAPSPSLERADSH